MDLLGSIMKSMDKPPCLSENEKILIKSRFLLTANIKLIPLFLERKEELERRQKEEKEKMNRFKDRVELKLLSHFKDPKNLMLKFEPMDHIYRSIV